MEAKKTIVVGTSPQPSRYAYLAVNRLLAKGYEVIPLGIVKGAINGLQIETEKKSFKDIHTVTFYINPSIQKEYYDYIINVIKPKRIIFNPGAENPEFERIATAKGIKVEEACTLVLLSSNQY